MNNEEKLQSVEQETKNLKADDAELDLQHIKLVGENIGKQKKDSKIEQQRKKLARNKIRIQELTDVKEDLKKKIADAEAMEATEQLKESASRIPGELKTCQVETNTVNTLTTELEQAVVSLKHPLARLSETILKCHEAKKTEYLDMEGIRNAIVNLMLNTPDHRLIDDKNLETQTGLNQFNNALEGKGYFSKAKAPIQFTPTEQQNTEEQALREQMELDRFKHGSAF
jgi:hypothetical protein